MKRFITFVMMLLLAASVSSAWADEGYHTVSKGESLSEIGWHYGVHWQTIKKVNGLKSTIIHPGQRLLIPESEKALWSSRIRAKKNPHITFQSHKVWKRVGSNPYQGTAQWAIKHSRLPEDVKVAVLRNIKENHFRWYEHGLQSGQHLDWMTFGKNEVSYDINTEWDPNKLYAAKDYGVAGYRVLHVEKCHNWGGWREEIPVVSPEVTLSSPMAATEFPNVSVFPSVSPAQVNKRRDTWDWYVGAGNYVSRLEGKDNNGQYAWMKFRYRPFWFDPTEKVSIGIGAFGFIAGGNGKANRYYTYDWNERVFGLTGKILAEHKDFDIDIGGGKLYNNGKWMGQKVTRQVDDILLASVHENYYARRDAGKKWWPGWEANAEGRFPFSTKVFQGQKTDNQTVTLMFTQWIYDFDVNNDKSLVITPGFNLGGGYENSSADRGFLQVGPATKIYSYDQTIAGLNILNYKFQGTGQWQPIGAYISLDGIYKAVHASMIQEATAAELNDLPADGESKLLHNPADYLK